MPEGAWSRMVAPDTRLLFRFSALTFNAHRIHYDRPYAMSEEGYPGLVVHGPLTAILLSELVRHNTSLGIAGFSFRGQAPLFDLAPFHLVGRPSDGFVTLPCREREGSAPQELSGRCDSGPPRGHRRSAKRAMRLGGVEMALDVEGIVDGGVCGKKFLG